MPERIGDVFGLVDHAAADRTDVDLDEADDVRVLLLDETGDSIEHPAAGTQIAGARERQMEGRSNARGVANVVDEQAQAESMLTLRRTKVEWARNYSD